MTSEPLNSLFVWIWLPDATEPVVAGRLDRRGDRFVFSYGRSYLDRPGATAIYLPELPPDRSEHEPLDGPIPLCIHDAAPDSWGRAVINAHLGQVGNELDILTYLVEFGSDRVGALDFQRSPTEYISRAPFHAPLEQLLVATDVVAAGETLDPDLARALVNGTPLGGARPKALIDDSGKEVSREVLEVHRHVPVGPVRVRGHGTRRPLRARRRACALCRSDGAWGAAGGTV